FPCQVPLLPFPVVPSGRPVAASGCSLFPAGRKPVLSPSHLPLSAWHSSAAPRPVACAVRRCPLRPETVMPPFSGCPPAASAPLRAAQMSPGTVAAHPALRLSQTSALPASHSADRLLPA